MHVHRGLSTPGGRSEVFASHPGEHSRVKVTRSHGLWRVGGNLLRWWKMEIVVDKSARWAHQSRFLILDAARQPNLASDVLAHFLRELPGQWQECFGYLPLLAETFTDPESHAGTCYKARGWEPVGLSRRDGRHYAEKFPGPLSSKKLWIKPLDPRAFEWLCLPELPEVCQAGVVEYAAERCPLRANHLKSLFQTFQTIKDPRSRRARTIPLGAVLSLVALGLLRGAVHLNAIVRQAGKLTQNQRRSLRLPFKKGTRFVKVPCYDVFREVLRRVDLAQLAGALTGWMQAHAGELPRTLAIDGKIIPEARQLLRAQTKDLSQPQPPPVPRRDPAPTPEGGEVRPARGPDIIRYFVCSLDPAEAHPKRLAEAIRNHWGCETQHWRRDVLWREDKCLIRNPNAACALALLRVGLQSLLVGVGRKSLSPRL